jgi:hypothetical protein
MRQEKNQGHNEKARKKSGKKRGNKGKEQVS